MSLTQLLDAPEISAQPRKQQVKLSLLFVSRCQIQALHASVDRIAMRENERLELHMNIYICILKPELYLLLQTALSM